MSFLFCSGTGEAIMNKINELNMIYSILLRPFSQERQWGLRGPFWKYAVSCPFQHFYQGENRYKECDKQPWRRCKSPRGGQKNRYDNRERGVLKEAQGLGQSFKNQTNLSRNHGLPPTEHMTLGKSFILAKLSFLIGKHLPCNVIVII